MKLLNVSTVAILIAILFLPSCIKDKLCINGEGTITTRTLSIPDFTGIELAGANDVIISQGTTQEVKATGHPNIIDRIKTNVSGNVWTFSLENGCYNNYELTIYITVPNINKIYITGSGDITVNDFTNQGDLLVNISGSGDIDLNAFGSSENLSINISGSGTVVGNADFSALKELDINISGSGDYNGFPIKTDECEISIPGSGNCNVYVRDILDVTISGSGSVYYKGNPTVTQSISGSGSVINDN